MKIAVMGRKMDVTDALQAYTEKKLSKLDRFFTDDSGAQVKFHSERGRYTIEVTVQCAGMVFRAQKVASDAYAAVDAVEEMIERQILKNKTRLEKRLRSGAFDTSAAGADAAQAAEPEETYELIRRKRFALKPMAVEEAILQMNLLDHAFYAFKNAEDDNRYCVVYRRNDGGYGLIESD